MSLLHSFYCWGSVGVILLSTIFFAIFGIENWRILACIWALIPLYNTFNFISCPIESLTEEGEGLSIRQLCDRIPCLYVQPGIGYRMARHFLDCACPYGLRRCKRNFDGTMGLCLCRVRTWHFQKHRRHHRPLPICCYDGNESFLLWKIW